MAVPGDAFDYLETAIAEAAAFHAFILDAGGTSETAADYVFLHDWAPRTTREDRYEEAEITADYAAYALLRMPDDGGCRIQKRLATRTAFIFGQIEVEFARTVPTAHQASESVALQGALDAVGPIAIEVMDGTDGFFQEAILSMGPWRSHRDYRDTEGDLYGATYTFVWGHQGGK